VEVTRILHVSVNTTGAAEASAVFYRDLLGLQAGRRPDIPGTPGHWFDVGGAQVHLIGRAVSGGALDGAAHHVCLGVADLEAAVAELQAAGVPHRRAEIRREGEPIRQVFVSDPAGNLVELQQD